MTCLEAGEGIPSLLIQKDLAATWAHHTSRQTPLHLDSPPHRCGFVSWVMDSHAWQLHLARGQKAQAGFRCVPSLSLSEINARALWGEGLYLQAKCIDPVQTTGYLSVRRV